MLLCFSKKGASEVISYILIIFVVIVVIGIVVLGVMPAIEKSNSKKSHDLSYKYIEEINQKINQVLQEPTGSSKSVFLDLSNKSLEIDSSLKTLEISHNIKGDYYKEGLFVREGKIYTKRELDKLIVGLDLKDLSFSGDLSLMNTTSQIYIVKVSKNKIHFTNEVDSSENPAFLNQQINRPDIDRDAPLTSIIVTKDDSEEYLTGWTDSSYLLVNFLVDDDSETTTYYCFDQDNTCIPNIEYTQDANLYSPGINYVRFFSQDEQRNKEEIKSREVKLERCLFPTTGRWNIDGIEVCGDRTIEVPEFIYIESGDELILHNVTLNLTFNSTTGLNVYTGGILRVFGGVIKGTRGGVYPYVRLYGTGYAQIEDMVSPGTNPGQIRILVQDTASADINNSYFHNGYLYTSTKVNLENSTIPNFNLYLSQFNTLDINNFDSRLTNNNVRFLTSTGDINIINSNIANGFSLHTITVTTTLNIYNSYLRNLIYYNYDGGSGYIENSSFYTFSYHLYANRAVTLEDMTYPAVNLTKTISTTHNTLELVDVNYSLLYTYSNTPSGSSIYNSKFYVFYFLANSVNFFNYAENIEAVVLFYIYQGSKNVVKDSTIVGLCNFYNTSDTNFINVKLLPSGSYNLRLYDTAKINFIDTNSTISKLNLIAGTHNPTISGYVKITSLAAWGAGNVLKRYLPFNVKFSDDTFAENVLIEIKDENTLIDSGTTDENGFVELLIEADNSSNPYKEYSVYADGLFIKTITILEDSSFGVEVNINLFDYNWLYKKEITIDYTKVEEDLENFPLLFSVVDDDLKNYAKVDGSDIVFTNQDKTIKFKREIEDYNSLTGNLIAWVNIPTLSSTEDTNLYIYFGNEDANEINDKDTWDENYSVVMHFNGNTLDSTINNINGNIIGSLDLSLDRFGKNNSYDFTNGYVEISKPFDQNNLEQIWTIDAWYYINDKANYQNVVGYGFNRGCSVIYSTTGNPLLYLNSGDNDYYIYGSGNNIDTNTWQKITFRFRNSDSYRKIYVNGEDISTSGPNRTNIPFGIVETIKIGDVLRGSLDELRISNKIRSDGWIKTEFLNQSNPSSFYTVGSLQER
jgi:hypothetical protein